MIDIESRLESNAWEHEKRQSTAKYCDTHQFHLICHTSMVYLNRFPGLTE